MRKFTYQDDADDYADEVFHRYVEKHGRYPRPLTDHLRVLSLRVTMPKDKTSPEYAAWVEKVYRSATEAENFQAFIDDVFRSER